MRTSKQLCKTAEFPPRLMAFPSPRFLAPTGLSILTGISTRAASRLRFIEPMPLKCQMATPSPITMDLPRLGPNTGRLLCELRSLCEHHAISKSWVIETQINPEYKAKNDTVEFNADYKAFPTLTFTSQTGFNNDFLWSTEDYNRFDTAPGAFVYCDPADNGNCELNANQLGELTRDPDGLGHCQNTYSSQCSALPLAAPCSLQPAAPRTMALVRLTACSVIRNSVAVIASSRKICRTNIHGNSARSSSGLKFCWPRQFQRRRQLPSL